MLSMTHFGAGCEVDFPEKKTKTNSYLEPVPGVDRYTLISQLAWLGPWGS